MAEPEEILQIIAILQDGDSILGDIDEIIEGTEQGIDDEITEEVVKVIESADDSDRRIDDKVGTIIEETEGVSMEAVNVLRLRIAELTAINEGLVEELDAFWREVVDASNSDADSAISVLETKLAQGFEDQQAEIDASRAAMEAIFSDRITEETRKILQATDHAAITTDSKLGLAIESASGIAATALEKSTSAITILQEVLPSAIGAAVGAPIGSLTEAFGPLLGGLSKLVGFFSVEKWEEAFEQVDEIYKTVEEAPGIGEIIKVLSPKGAIATGIIGLGLLAGFVTTLITSAGSAAFAGQLEKARQWSFEQAQPGLLSPPELQALQNRGEIEELAVEGELRKHGFSFDKIQQVKLLRFQLLNLGELISLWRRNEIETEELEERLQHLGFKRDDLPHIRTLAFQVPAVQDVILFAVREVFDIETAERFGQYEGIPAETLAQFKETFGRFGEGVEGSILAFQEYAKQGGLSPEWATAYWASHWRLPGVTQLFDMVHRLSPEIVAARADDYKAMGLDPDKLAFNLDDLMRTLRAQDYTPYFRERITALSYRPLTRVDVRRIHKLGLIKDDQLQRRYQELGYGDADSAMMKDFTLAYNAGPVASEIEETKRLTRSQILTFLEEGKFSPEGAAGLITEIGYTKQVATIFVELAQLEKLRKQRAQQVRALRERFKSGILDFNEAVTTLDTFSLTPTERDVILADFEADVAASVKFPSRSELDLLAKAGQLKSFEYQFAIEKLGYPPPWPEKFRDALFAKDRIDFQDELPPEEVRRQTIAIPTAEEQAIATVTAAELLENE